MPLTPKQLASRKGGRAVLAKHGKDHFREIGRKGYLATVARHFQGDTEAYRRFLALRNLGVSVDRLADREIDRRLNDGAEIASCEISPMGPDGDEDDGFGLLAAGPGK